MYHIVYKTTNVANGKIYVGVHSSENEMDEYLGSGTILKNSIEKYGRENFLRENLFCLENIEDAYEIESMIVDDLFISRGDVYNIKIGGRGGFDHINLEEKEKRGEWARKGGRSCFLTHGALSHREEHGIATSVRNIETDSHIRLNTESAKKARIEVFEKIEHQKGSKNSQYGTCWIFNVQLEQNKKVPLEELSDWEAKGWFKGRKMKF